ncbi:hypothetical protein C445_03078 [Halobiforma lacisalsi AJ5]|uniref:Uncharacterized protein n=1 Tax=Natronobacterium lacisalsi AJ5 TaxID=358396 RepID=M0LWA7_NATLA|nr:hypothetical protein C445_03078 [Halobiforma lacisalsi AJ5]
MSVLDVLREVLECGVDGVGQPLVAARDLNCEIGRAVPANRSSDLTVSVSRSNSAPAIAVATPCCPAPVSAISRSRPVRSASSA